MEKLKLNLTWPQKAINQLIEEKINEIIDYLNKQNTDIKIIEEKEENDEKTIDTDK